MPHGVGQHKPMSVSYQEIVLKVELFSHIVPLLT